MLVKCVIFLGLPFLCILCKNVKLHSYLLSTTDVSFNNDIKYNVECLEFMDQSGWRKRKQNGNIINDDYCVLFERASIK